MSWFTDLFSSGVSDVITSAGKAIDDLVTSDKESATLKIALEKELNKFEKNQLDTIAKLDNEITQRHANDMTSDSWLSKTYGL